jgi:hypothetical protein
VVLLMQGSLYCCYVCFCYTLMFLGVERRIISLCVQQVMITTFGDLLRFDYLIMGSKEINYLLDITLPHS